MKKNTLKPMVIALALLWSSPHLWAADGENLQNGKVQNTETLKTTEVIGTKSKDEIGKNRTYSREVVNLYKGKEEIETYKGNTVSDLLKGIVGVYSGDSRNSGAVDPNIRGVQGQGRIPVTIDGTEQAITVWRGYAGANNRNYVDPNIISSVYVEKGPSFSRDVKSGLGGSIAMKTIDVDDVVPAGQKYGLEVKMETANNSIKARQNAYEGSVDYRTLPNPEVAVGGIWRAFLDDTDRVDQRFNGRNKFLEDKAYRIAAGTKQENFDAMIAYAYRSKGNYFSGKKGAKEYGYIGKITPEKLEEIERLEKEARERGENYWGSENMLGAPNVSKIGFFYHPGGEVTNTSLETKSWVGKTTFRLPNHQTIKLGLRDTNTTFGEMMPSRIIGPFPDKNNLNKVGEWPDSWVKQKSYNMDYSWKPEDNRWIDFEASVWATRTKSKTNTAGGSPGDSLYEDRAFHRDYDMWKTIMSEWHTYDEETKKAMIEYGYGPNNKPKPTTPNTDGRFNTVEGQALYANNNRTGFTFSNRMKLRDNLDLTIIGDFQNEKLRSRDNYSEEMFKSYGKYRDEQDADILRPNYSLNEMGSPRNGRRREFNLGLNFNFRPWDWLTLNAGARYTHFTLQDDSQQAKTGLDKWGRPLKLDRGEYFSLSRVLTPKEYQDYLYAQSIKEENPDTWNLLPDTDRYKSWYAHNNIEDRLSHITSVNGIPYFNNLSKEDLQIMREYGIDNVRTFLTWERDKTGRLNLANHPILNNAPELSEKTVNPLNPNELVNKYHSDYADESPLKPEITAAELKRLQKQSDGGWVPSFGATVHFSDNARAYVRYTELLRYPSIFEGTFGFSTGHGAWATRAGYGWRPEHAKNWEVGYIHDLTALLPKMRKADFRINYFHNKTENIIDRDQYLNFEQFDLQRRSGVELSARFDTGRVFGNVGVLRNIKNEMCDQIFGFQHDYYRENNGDSLKCNHGGLADNGYLATAIQPRWSVDAELGARFFESKLETGLRLHYHSRVYEDRRAVWNDYYRRMAEKHGSEPNVKGYSETGWRPTQVWDAYLRYKVTKNITAELVGTNLTNRYYLDPLSPSYMPAPGRTIRLGITGKF